MKRKINIIILSLRLIYERNLDSDSYPNLVKVDIVIYDLVYPIDSSIIYDFDNGEIPKFDLINDLLDEVMDKQVPLYKAFKRLDSIARILNLGSLFDDILDKTELGVMFLSKTRLKLLKEVQNKISNEHMEKYKNSIQEDLRTYGYKLTDDLDKLMDAKLVGNHALKKYYIF